jgi:hypothetical protein
MPLDMESSVLEFLTFWQYYSVEVVHCELESPLVGTATARAARARIDRIFETTAESKSARASAGCVSCWV